MITDEQEATLAGMSAINSSHIRNVIECNEAHTFFEHALRQAVLDGFREGIIVGLGISLGSLMMEANSYYIIKGINRPMCGGVFLDWVEAKKEQAA